MTCDCGGSRRGTLSWCPQPSCKHDVDEDAGPTTQEGQGQQEDQQAGVGEHRRLT
jgi:hypothetical protein